MHLNTYGGYAHIDLAGANTSSGGYIDFTLARTYYKGRMVYIHAGSQFEWMIADSGTPKMTLKSAGLYLGATLVSATDKRLKFNYKPLDNALDIIGRLEPVEYDQTSNLVEDYTPENAPISPTRLYCPIGREDRRA